jgi:hypothetical protein
MTIFAMSGPAEQFYTGAGALPVDHRQFSVCSQSSELITCGGIDSMVGSRQACRSLEIYHERINQTYCCRALGRCCAVGGAACRRGADVIVGGLAKSGVAIIGATQPYGYYGYDPGYGDVAPYAGGSQVGYCQQRFRSYDPSSGTYLGFDGLRHPCP